MLARNAHTVYLVAGRTSAGFLLVFHLPPEASAGRKFTPRFNQHKGMSWELP